MTMFLVFGPIVLATLLSVAGWLVKRNEDQHERLDAAIRDLKTEDIGGLKVGQARIESKVDILLEDRKNG